MTNTSISTITRDFQSYVGKEVHIAGWIKTNRSSKSVGFIELSDGSQFQGIQIVYDDSMHNFSDISHFTLSSTIDVKGELVLTPEAKQPFEIKATSIDLLFEADRDYPLQKKRHSLEFLRTIQHLRPRTNTFQAVFRVRSILAHAIHEFFQDRGFVYVHTPIITSNDAEGAGEMFQVTTLPLDQPVKDYSSDFFGKKVGLTVSGQLAVEPFAHTFGRVYTFGPTFRAENSNTPRHASEFWMIEPEMSFFDLDMMLDLIEEFIKEITQKVLDRAPAEMDFFNQRIEPGILDRLHAVIESDFARVTYTEAIEILKESKKDFDYAPQWGVEIQTEHEKYLSGEYYKRPVFVTDYPREAKAFYMKQSADGKTVRAVDLLVPEIGEIVGGSQREEDYQTLKDEILRRGLEIEDYQWYLDLRRFGSIEHSGFGLGFERMLRFVTGIQNIRDVIAYPRTPNSAEF